MKKFIVLSIVLLMLAGFAITSSAMEVKTLVAGQNIDVGTLTVLIEDGHLVVRYDTNPEGCEWELLETHLYVGNERPTKSAPGQFPYGAESEHIVIDEVCFVEYYIPLDDFTLPDTLYIAAHAEVRKQIGVVEDEPIYQEETAWAEGETSIPPGKNWATYFDFPVSICWSLIGDWVITAYVGDFGSGFPYIHGMTITDDSFIGLDYYPFGNTNATGDIIDGIVTGNNVEWTNETKGSPYEADIDGTIADDGTMSGTWSDSNNLSGDWESTDGAATLIYCN